MAIVETVRFTTRYRETVLWLPELDVAVMASGRADDFAVVYGLQSRTDLRWREAAVELGECVFHALEAEGRIRRGR